MQIKELRLDRFKGLTLAEEIHPLMLYSGPNGSGKSARLQAIQWAATGCSALGRKPEAAMVYGSPAGMSVGVRLDDKFVFYRELTMDTREGKISQLLGTNSTERGGARDTQARIEEHIGRFMPMWDLNEFLALSSDKRREMVLALCGKAAGKTWAPSEVETAIQVGILTEILGVGTVASALPDESWDSPAYQTALVNLVAKVGEDYRVELSSYFACLKRLPDEDLVDFVAAATEITKERISQSKATADAATQAARALSDRRAEIQVPSGSVDDLRQTRDAFSVQLEDVLKQIGVQLGKESARRSLHQELARCREQIERTKHQKGMVCGADPAAEMAEALGLEQQADDLAATLTEMDDQSTVLEAAMSTARNNREKVNAFREQVRLEAQRHESLLRQAESSLKAAESSDWVEAARLVKELQYMGVGGAVQLEQLLTICHRNADPDLIDRLRNEVENDRLNFVAAGDLLATCKSDACACDESVAITEAAYSEHVNALLQRRRANDEVMGKIRQLRQDADTIRARLAERDKSIDALASQLESLDNRRIDLEKKLNDVEAEGGQVPLAELQTSETALRGQLRATEENIEALIRYSNLGAELNRSIAKAEQQRVCHEIAKAGMEAIRGVRERLMVVMVQPILSHINQFFAACGVGDVSAYCKLENHRGTPIFDLGLGDREREVSIDAMSGGEAVIFYAALAYAMTRLADPPLKVLLIEAAELDAYAAEHLVDGLVFASETMSNVIVASCQRGMEVAVGESEGWHVVQCRPDEVAS